MDSLKKSTVLQKNCSIAELNVSSAITDSLLNTETVKYYNSQTVEHKKIDQFLQESVHANTALFSGNGTFLVIQTLIIAGVLPFCPIK